MTHRKPWSIAMLIATFAAAGALVAPCATLAQSPPVAEVGKAVYKRANCVGCHKWHGNGGGGYGGDALSLRKTELTREQIAETVGCGRPGKGMPFFTRGAYDTVKCYDMTRQEAGSHMPPEANTFLRPADIEAVADYVIAHIKGRGEPNYPECVSFFGDSSRVCDIYKTAPAEISQAATMQDMKPQDSKPQDPRPQDLPAEISPTAVGRSP